MAIFWIKFSKWWDGKTPGNWYRNDEISGRHRSHDRGLLDSRERVQPQFSNGDWVQISEQSQQAHNALRWATQINANTPQSLAREIFKEEMSYRELFRELKTARGWPNWAHFNSENIVKTIEGLNRVVQARVLLLSWRYKDALAFYDENSQNPEDVYNLWVCLFQTGNLEKSKIVLAKAASLGHLNAWIKLALIYLSSKDEELIKLGKKYLQEALEISIQTWQTDKAMQILKIMYSTFKCHNKGKKSGFTYYLWKHYITKASAFDKQDSATIKSLLWIAYFCFQESAEVLTRQEQSEVWQTNQSWNNVEPQSDTIDPETVTNREEEKKKNLMTASDILKEAWDKLLELNDFEHAEACFRKSFDYDDSNIEAIFSLWVLHYNEMLSLISNEDFNRAEELYKAAMEFYKIYKHQWWQTDRLFEMPDLLQMHIDARNEYSDETDMPNNEYSD